jgi:3'(2'), 5'-bisphosphate nucleotidase
MEVTENLIVKSLHVAFLAGKAIMEVYSKPFGIEYKEDKSPLTIADKKAHLIIASGLSDTGIPLLSEEGADIHYDIRKNWTDFWLIDPLDGTKEFIKKNGDFTVNIALISKEQPVFGVVYAPVPGFLFWGSMLGSFRLDVSKMKETDFENYDHIMKSAEQLPCITRKEGYLVLGSRSHMNAETESFIAGLKERHEGLSFISRGSSLKFCTLAEGGADVYPRFGPTMEWDTAAGHAVAFFAGCTILQADSQLPLMYNKVSLLNPFFIAYKKNEATI